MKKTMVSSSAFIAICCLFFALALITAGCGKIGNPRPVKSQETFDFSSFSASGAGNCLVIQGAVSGNAANLEYLGLELSPVNGPEDCPGCPFNPREYAEFGASDAQLDAQSGRFAFSYCPDISAPTYRWRLVGKNVYHGLPYVLTNPRLVVMPR